MGLIFQVGETSEFPPKPKGFPICGDWSPEVDAYDEERRSAPRRNEFWNDMFEDVFNGATSLNNVSNIWRYASYFLVLLMCWLYSST
jgi:hypothetical protein